ncbi:MAG: ribonuclease P protein component [Armatimonadetes bacterium]|nr:ribonuclease P protein component [Armatimonadota bacterium]
MGRLKGPRPSRFDEIFDTGLTSSSPNLKLYSLPGQGLLGIATSRKLGSRPRRNLFKRRMKAIATNYGDQMANFDWVVSVKHSAAQATYPDLATELGELITESLRRWEKQSEFS